MTSPEWNIGFLVVNRWEMQADEQWSQLRLFLCFFYPLIRSLSV